MRYVAGRESKERTEETEQALFNMFQTHGNEVNVDPLKDPLQNHDFVLALRSDHLSVSRSRFATCGYNQFLKNYMEGISSIHKRLDLWNRFERFCF